MSRLQMGDTPDLKVNERLVKLSMSKVFIGQDLKLGDDVQLTVIGNVTKIEHEDQQDGSYDLVYVVKGIIATVNDEEIQ